MSAPKQSLLLVDSDPRSCRVLEVSLRKAGFAVTTAANGVDALEKALAGRPELIISDTAMPVMDGFELRRRLRQSGDLGEVPFIFLTSQRSVEDKIKGLELGVEDYLTKPIYIREILTRVRIALQKSHRLPTDPGRRADVRTKFAGQLTDMGVVDLIQTLEISRKSGVIHVNGPGGRRATLFFRNGSIIDAELGRLAGEEAIYRLLTWSEGEFEVDFKAIRRKDVVSQSAQALLMEGMRRLDEWSRLVEQLPPLEEVLEVDTDALGRRLGEVPDEANQVLKLFDGRRSLLEVIEDGRLPDLEAITLIARLHTDGFLCVPMTSPPSEGPDGRAADGWFLGEKSGVYGITRAAAAALRGQGGDSGRQQHIKRPTLRGFQLVVEPERRDAASRVGKSTLRGLSAQGATPAGFGGESTNGGLRSEGGAGPLTTRDVVRARAATMPITSKASPVEARHEGELPRSAVEAAFPELAAPRERERAASPVPFARSNGTAVGRLALVEGARGARPVRAGSEPPLEVEQDSVISELPAPPVAVPGRPTLGELAAEATRPDELAKAAEVARAIEQVATHERGAAAAVDADVRAAEVASPVADAKVADAKVADAKVDAPNGASSTARGHAPTKEIPAPRKSRALTMVDEALAAAEPLVDGPQAAAAKPAANAQSAADAQSAANAQSAPDAKPVDAKPVDAKPVDAKPVDAKSGDPKPAAAASTLRGNGAVPLPSGPPPPRATTQGEPRKSSVLAAQLDAGRTTGSSRALAAGVVSGGTSAADGRRRRGLAAAGALAGVAAVILGLVVRDAMKSRPSDPARAAALAGAPMTPDDDRMPTLSADGAATLTALTPTLTPTPTLEPTPTPTPTAPIVLPPAVIPVTQRVESLPTPVPTPVPPIAPPVARVTPALTLTPAPTPTPVTAPRATPTPASTPPRQVVASAPTPTRPKVIEAPDPTLSYGALYEQARMASRQGRGDDAIALLDRALVLNANGEDALLLKAKLLRDRKRAADALRLIERYLAARPYSVEGWRQKGLVHFDLGNLGEAKTAMEKALALAPPGSADAEAIRALLESM